MRVRKSVLWQVPAYCAAAGLIAHYLIRPVFLPYTKVTQPDGSTTVSQFREMLLYALIFAVTLLIGWLLFRHMTRRELFWSAAILVAAYLITGLLIQVLQPGRGPLWAVFWFLVDTQEWAFFISSFCHWALNSIINFDVLAPFLFVFFGTGSLVETSA